MAAIKRIIVLGKEGPDSWALLKNARIAAEKLKLRRCTVSLVTDPEQIFRYGVYLLPGLVTDGNVRVIGRVAPVDELIKILQLILNYGEKPPLIG